MKTSSVSYKQVLYQIHSILMPHTLVLSMSFVMEKITCVIADLALFFRLWHYHPSVLYTSKKKWLRLGPLVVLTPPRVILGFVYSRYSGLHQRSLAAKINLAEFVVQMAYCLYATGESM